jgi:PAS domain S-box-containing protein
MDALASPELCRALVEHGADCVKTLSLDGRIESMSNSGLYAMEIADFALVAGTDFASSWPEELQPRVRDALRQAREGGVARFQGRCPTARGTPKWWDVVISLVRDAQGVPWRLAAVSRDISEFRASTEETAASEARYRLLAENTTDVIVRAALDGTLLYVSPSCRAFGYEPEELIGRRAEEHVHPDDLARFQVNTAALLTDPSIDRTADRQHRFLTKDGGWVWLEGNPRLVRDKAGRPVEIMNAFRDVTEPKRAAIALEEALTSRRLEVERMGLAVKAAHVGIWEWDLATGAHQWDERMYELYGLDQTDGPPDLSAFVELFHKDDQQRIQAEIQATVRDGAPFDTEFRILFFDGSVRHIRAMATAVRNEAGRVTRVVGTNWDITATRLLEASLRASETRNRNVISHAHQAIVTIDHCGLVTGWNHHAELIFGWTAAEALGQQVSELIIPPRYRPSHRTGMARFLATGQDTVIDTRLELTALRKGGEEFPIELAVSAVPGPAGWELTALMQDISARKAQVELFENAFHHAPIGMALVGLDGQFLKVNDAYCGIIGYPEPEMLALDFQAITHCEDLSADLDLLARLLAGDIPSYQMDKRYIRADGSAVWVRLSVSLVMEEGGKPKYFVAQVQDLTAHRQAREALERKTQDLEAAKTAALTTNKLMRAAEDVASMGYWTWDVETDETTWSEQIWRILGIQPDGQKPSFKLIQSVRHPEDRATAKFEFENALKSGDSFNNAYRIVLPNGEVRYLLSRGVVSQQDGKTKSAFGIMMDITELKRAEAAVRDSETRYRLIAENSTDMIVTTDSAGRITFLAPSCRAIIGYEPEDMIGLRPLDYAHPDDTAAVARVFDNLAAGAAPERVRWRLRHKHEDRWVWLESNPALLGSDVGTGYGFFVDVIRDVTAQVAQEQALAQATAAAEAATAVKSEFLANMSHEIRTPLTAVLGFAGLLSARRDLDDDARAHVDRVASASSALLAIVNDILDFSKLESGHFEIALRPVSPVETAREALSMFEPQAKAKGLALDFVAEGELPAFVATDPDRLRQILLNLVGNAIKFTERGSVRLHIRHDAARLHVEVVDTGAGLSQAQQRKLFQRFSQVDASSTRRHGGTGLGLAICRGLVEAMGGEIGVRSRRGKGSAFYFSIVAPAAVADIDAGPEDITGSDQPLDGVRVLVVDDNPLNLELAHAILTHMGAEFTRAGDGLAAIAAAKALPYDVVLLDVRMPGLDGPATLARIRREPGPNQNIPILAFSADNDLARFRQAGFDGVIRKPIDPVALVSTIIETIESGYSDQADVA